MQRSPGCLEEPGAARGSAGRGCRDWRVSAQLDGSGGRPRSVQPVFESGAIAASWTRRTTRQDPSTRSGLTWAPPPTSGSRPRSAPGCPSAACWPSRSSPMHFLCSRTSKRPASGQQPSVASPSPLRLTGQPCVHRGGRVSGRVPHGRSRSARAGARRSWYGCERSRRSPRNCRAGCPVPRRRPSGRPHTRPGAEHRTSRTPSNSAAHNVRMAAMASPDGSPTCRPRHDTPLDDSQGSGGARPERG